MSYIDHTHCSEVDLSLTWSNYSRVYAIGRANGESDDASHRHSFDVHLCAKYLAIYRQLYLIASIGYRRD